MIFDLKLIRNQGFPWFNYEENIFVKGFIYNQDNQILKGLNFINYIKDKINSKIYTLEFLKELNGNYIIILFKNEELIVISDKLNSFPIFYKYSYNCVHISDEFEELTDSNSKLIQCNIDQFILAGYVMDNETIYDNIFQTRACEILTFTNNGIRRTPYFYLVKSNNDDFGLDFYNQKYVNTINNIGERLVNGAESRQFLLFLSAGFDSRLIANMLFQQNYKNVITVTYGSKDTYEKEIAKNVADKLGFEWHFVEYSDNFLKNIIRKNDFNEFVKFSANGTSRPHIQDVFAIEHLLSNKIIDKESIVLNGNRPRIKISDFYGLANDLLEFDYKKTIEHIININFITDDKNLRKVLFEIIMKIISPGTPPDQMDDWNLKEFISKYLFNLSRNYNYFGLEYRTPLIDNEFLEFIKELPIHYKQDYKFYDTANKELIFKSTGTDFSNSAYSGIKKYSLINSILSNNKVKKFISGNLEKFIPKYRDPNNLRCIIEELFPEYIKANTREEWYNYNISRWYLEKFKLYPKNSI